MSRETKSGRENLFATESYWDMVSAGYGIIASIVMEPFSIRAMELSPLRKHFTAIDVACGPGTLALPLAEKISKVVATDFSSKMIEELGKAAGKREKGNIETVQCDGQELPFDDNTFDVGYSLFGLMFFPDRHQGFRELYRVLKPGCSAIVSGWAPIEKSQLMTLLLNAVKAGYPDAPSPRRNFALDDPKVFKNEMENAGFKKVTIYEEICTIPPIKPGEFWEIMSTGGPLLMMKKELEEDKWKTITKEAIKYLTNKVGKEGLETFTTAYLGVGEKDGFRVG